MTGERPVQQMLLVPARIPFGHTWASPTASGDHFCMSLQLSAQVPMLLFLEGNGSAQAQDRPEG